MYFLATAKVIFTERQTHFLSVWSLSREDMLLEKVEYIGPLLYSVIHNFFCLFWLARGKGYFFYMTILPSTALRICTRDAERHHRRRPH